MPNEDFEPVVVPGRCRLLVTMNGVVQLDEEIIAEKGKTLRKSVRLKPAEK